MSVIDQPKERAWEEGAASTVALMGSINLATAQLVATFRLLIDSEGWHEGNPEDRTLRFHDARGRPIEPPRPARRGSFASTSRVPSPHPSANASTPAGSAGTDAAP